MKNRPKKGLKEVKILTIGCQYINILDPTRASHVESWRSAIMITIPKPREEFTAFGVICDYTLNDFTMTSGNY